MLGDDIVQLIDNALFEVAQCEEYTSFINCTRYTVCMQVLEQLKVALFLVDIAQPLNHQLAVLKVNPLYIVYVQSSNYVTLVYMSKQDTIFKGV